jgi:hypothetical protein
MIKKNSNPKPNFLKVVQLAMKPFSNCFWVVISVDSGYRWNQQVLFWLKKVLHKCFEQHYGHTSVWVGLD